MLRTALFSVLLRICLLLVLAKDVESSDKSPRFCNLGAICFAVDLTMTGVQQLTNQFATQFDQIAQSPTNASYSMVGFGNDEELVIDSTLGSSAFLAQTRAKTIIKSNISAASTKCYQMLQKVNTSRAKVLFIVGSHFDETDLYNGNMVISEIKKSGILVFAGGDGTVPFHWPSFDLIPYWIDFRYRSSNRLYENVPLKTCVHLSHNVEKSFLTPSESINGTFILQNLGYNSGENVTIAIEQAVGAVSDANCTEFTFNIGTEHSVSVSQSNQMICTYEEPILCVQYVTLTLISIANQSAFTYNTKIISQSCASPYLIRFTVPNHPTFSYF